MNALTLPTRRDEAWRYSNLDAVEKVWEDLDPAQTLHVPADSHERLRVDALPESGILRYDVTVEANARFDLHCLLMDRDYGRVEIAVKLGDGAHFELGGAILAKGSQVLEIVTDVEHVEPNGTSNQTVRSVLADKSTGSFPRQDRAWRAMRSAPMPRNRSNPCCWTGARPPMPCRSWKFSRTM